MKFMRMHWFDIGLGLALAAGIYTAAARLSGLALLLWLNLIALFLHQAEEYRWPGYFPGMMNKVMFSSPQPDRYPLNPESAMLINVVVGWLFFFLAAVLNVNTPWLGIAVMLVSVGNFIAHTFLFNIRGRTLYNPGMATGILLFLPLAVLFFVQLIRLNAAAPLDWAGGIALGLALNAVGILKMIEWLKDRHTSHIFPPRFLIPGSRRH